MLFIDECVKKIDFPGEADVALVVVNIVGFGVCAAEMESQVAALQRVELEARTLELDVAADGVVKVNDVVVVAVEASFGEDNPFLANVEACAKQDGEVLGQEAGVLA